MKGFQRYLVLALCAMLAITLLAGCGKQEGTGEAKKVLTVGTSADYPPFESVDPSGEFVGFDMDLIRELGNRMGMEVQIVDMPFESLIASLKQGRVDAVIACMSPTPDRLEEADFTDAYYESKQAILINPASDVQIRELDDILNYEFAVQTGTTLDEWATARVAAGAIPDSKVKRYSDANAAALDLKQGRVAAFLLDLPVAYEKAAELNLAVVVETKLEEEANPGILLPKGSDEMLAKMNEIIAEMKADGFIEKLEDQWLRQG